MKIQHPTPSKEEIALLPEFPRLPISRITLVSTASQALAARDTLLRTRHWGFDTESKPTFVKDQVSDGPHILQLSTCDRAWVFQLHDLDCRGVAAQLLALPGYTKAGFGLGDDRRRIVSKLGVSRSMCWNSTRCFKHGATAKTWASKAALQCCSTNGLPSQKKRQRPTGRYRS